MNDYHPNSFRTSKFEQYLYSPKNYVQNEMLKLYCGYKYTRPYMINRIWGLKQL